ncbi:hypothetical protein NL108_004442 [Boleophthalmus pectinirostris]|uniref:uncharacterized protein LOC110161989 isoform X2 n=1 Tax=Boleophthalmus pectinirostris TaxID=150288 RepID=UPI000A1C2184|nr:uncharacterized protein LOC110161989 isoform X2 [Boleophthalmus pectinirostris]KAJ0063607.1 hypothetical protein NL108_004442 [Boleophthalmus pectinirostris]
MQKSRFAILLTLCFTCASATDDVQIEKSCMLKNQSCETHHLSTELGTSVLLPCNFTKHAQNIVSWIHSPAVTVVTITSTGQVNFSDPRFGRIHVFPNQGSQGNYSISIINVNHSDLGCYQCLNQERCVQVGLALKTEADTWLFPFYIYIVCGLAIFIVLGVGCFLCVRFLGNKDTEENHSVTAHHANDDLSHPTQESGRVPGDGQPQDTPQPRSPAYVNNTVYENDDIEEEPDYLNQIPERSQMDRNEASQRGHFNFVRMESQRNKQRFHTELINRLRQASIRKHYYVNQDELHKQRDTGPTKGAQKKKDKSHRQFPNPIYNRSAEDLDQM